MARIKKVGTTEQPDFFDYILSPGEAVSRPAEKCQLTHLGSLGLQMIDVFQLGAHGGLVARHFALSAQRARVIRPVGSGVRKKFTTYGDIDSGSLASLPFLHVFLEKTLRLFPANIESNSSVATVLKCSPSAVLKLMMVISSPTV